VKQLRCPAEAVLLVLIPIMCCAADALDERTELVGDRLVYLP
jgi:hypothetical protein